jgi:hypothetical protein
MHAVQDDAQVVWGSAYVGEGAYEGLEFHCSFAELDVAEGEVVVVHGWISAVG